MKKILIVNDNLQDQINGVCTTFNSIVPLAAKDGYEMVFLEPSQFTYFGAPGYPEIKLALPFGVEKKILEIKPDYVHIATEGPLGIAARLTLDRNDLKYNTSFHTKFPEYLHKIYNIPLEWTYSYMRWFHKHSGVVLTTTKTMVHHLKSNGFTGEIIEWTRGVDRDKLQPSIGQFGKKDVFIVMYVGRVSEEKSVEDVCKLWDNPKYRIVIVGDGPHRKELEKKYPHVNFWGYRTGSSLADAYFSADVLAFPSRTDTFGLVMIEAMSLGTPVAAYPVPGPLDVIEEGINGYMGENLHWAIERCLKIPRNNVKISSMKWTWDKCWNTFRDNLIGVHDDRKTRIATI